MDGAVWQFIAGGGEGDESAREAAVREASEEAGISLDCQWIELSSVGSVPREVFSAAVHWPSDLRAVPEYSFAVDVSGASLRLSPEHSEFRWLCDRDASEILCWGSNRAALAELVERLRNRA